MRWFWVWICLASATAAAGRNMKEAIKPQYMAGMELTSAISSGTLSLCACCGFSTHWSVYVKGAIDMTPTSGHAETESSIHHSALNPEYEPLRIKGWKDIFHTCISLQYWPAETGKGLHFNMGGRLDARGRSDCTVGIGYMFRIWKGFAASISYQAFICSSSKNGPATGKDIELHLYHMF